MSSAAMIGRGAHILRDHHGETPCGISSPYAQVYLRDGFCLFLGAPWQANTMFHVAEEICNPTYLRIARFRDAVVIDELGRRNSVSFVRYNCFQTGVKRNLAGMGPLFEERRAVRHEQIGEADCRLIRASDVVSISSDVIETHTERILSF